MYQNSLFLHLRGWGGGVPLHDVIFRGGVKIIMTKHDAGGRGGQKCPKLA